MWVSEIVPISLLLSLCSACFSLLNTSITQFPRIAYFHLFQLGSNTVPPPLLILPGINTPVLRKVMLKLFVVLSPSLGFLFLMVLAMDKNNGKKRSFCFDSK